eukprot:CAMPEP_0201724496 /NCGR_PEP_ID=MMETSP0593-20130828/8239_1 /ASSEMBLY_ACC=CAM_ASM_000672 /TAXON_ID=267983 /ORGANISM="Skeletonema japonicum, Strain CCMP2506" /LENGTH=40 /DNA_ID= /DNA_START= /DNA_END= /DNA_ORIENTATION=
MTDDLKAILTAWSLGLKLAQNLVNGKAALKVTRSELNLAY